MGLSLPDNGTISGDEVFLMVQRLDNHDQLILYNARNQKQKELLFLKTSPTSKKIFQAQILNPKSIKDGKIMCFCRKISQDTYRIYKMNESGSEYKWILRNSTCNYNFTADEKGIILLTSLHKFLQLNSIVLQSHLKLFQRARNRNRINVSSMLKCMKTSCITLMKSGMDEGFNEWSQEMIFKIVEMGYFEFTPDWAHLIITDFDNETIFIYDRADLKLIKRFKAGLKAPYTRSINHKTFFSPDGKIIYLLTNRETKAKAEGDKQQYYDYKYELIW